jgi:hypothetical protein
VRPRLNQHSMSTPNADPTHCPAPQLLSLPVEVTENITWRVGDDLYHLRRSCRDLQQKTWHVFKERYFSLRQVWIERKSLSTLLEISQYKPLADAVRTVVVACHHLSYSEVYVHQNYESVQDEEDDRAKAVRDLFNDQEVLKNDGSAMLMLGQAFSQLHNLKMVEIGDGYNAFETVKPEVAVEDEIDYEDAGDVDHETDYQLDENSDDEEYPGYFPEEKAPYRSRSMIKFENQHNVRLCLWSDDIFWPLQFIWFMVWKATRVSGVQLQRFNYKHGHSLDCHLFSAFSNATLDDLKMNSTSSLSTLRLDLATPETMVDQLR